MVVGGSARIITYMMRYAVATGMYSALPYAVAQGTVEMPYIFVQCLFFSVITYFLYHLQVDAGKPGASGHPWLVRGPYCCLAFRRS